MKKLFFAALVSVAVGGALASQAKINTVKTSPKTLVSYWEAPSCVEIECGNFDDTPCAELTLHTSTPCTTGNLIQVDEGNKRIVN